MKKQHFKALQHIEYKSYFKNERTVGINSRFAHFNGRFPGLHSDHLVNFRGESDQP